MTLLTRRSVLAGAGAALVGAPLAGCVGTGQQAAGGPILLPEGPAPASVYGAVTSEPFPVPAVNTDGIDPQFLRTTVAYASSEAPGTIIIDPKRHFLFEILGNGRANRYGIGVGREGFGWSGSATINSKQAWPDWYPPKEMIQRQPELRKELTELQSGIGMAGGPRNPLGARALYLWQNNKDTLYRIHGTVEPKTIGTNVSSGCIRMINQDVIDLYSRAPLGAKVIVLT
jgi:lipoprotein-anchoring transpeptidase ErfK/SrfK